MGLDDYKGISEAGELRAIEYMADKLRGRSFLHVNSTATGGGVAELMQRIIPLIRELDIDAKWKVIKGNKQFFEVTKRIHNSLQGQAGPLTDKMWDTYEKVNRKNGEKMNLDADCVFIHDPQPAMLIDHKKRGIWVWRCHIDISTPDKVMWYLLKDQVKKYDAAIFSVASFARSLPLPQYMIPPSIDPFSDKNIELSDAEIDEVFERFKVPRDKPILLQVSRFDPFKDPIGVIESFKMVKKYYDCTLVLAGGTADDDPEGERILAEVMEAAEGVEDLHILLLPPFSDKEINALQRGATIVIQKSTREGFGLVVAEALWKNKPVVAGDVGGIPLQVIDGVTGHLVHSVEGCAVRIRQLLQDPVRARNMGIMGREHIRRNYLITGHIRKYLALWLSMEYPGQDVINL
ncbi:Alpha,alpha-trehalose synthase [hydrothermal vent metagenome]|uniref:Alpha,alpha-trehalose synthase n=1 Tax=hydrothermal vent metagenome TaxID=652676 RepID=A0A3B0QS97_9ZZZZ